MFTGVKYATVHVTDQDKAVEFYTQRLGFDKRLEAPLGPESRWIEVAPPGAETTILLYKATEASPGADSLEDARSRVGAFTGIGLQVDDIKATFDKLRANGVTIIEEPDWKPWGWQAIFADQDGNRFVVTQQ